MRRQILTYLVALIVCLSGLPGSAQTTAIAPTIQPILVLNQERLLRESQKGQQILAKREELLSAHRLEGQRLDRELEQEERELTEMRDALPQEEFALLAEAFDQKVVQVRLDHQAKSEKLGQDIDAQRQLFFQQLVPIVAKIMEGRGAALVFESRAVMFSHPSVDITREVIAVMDKEAGFD